MDAFFVSVEIRDKPELVNLPVAVGGSSKNRGVLSTCNYIAREFGVRSAMATSVAMRKCPNLVLVPSRMDAYKEVSIHIREIFSRYTSIIEPLSLDEAYLDVTDCKLFKGSATLIAEDIRATIYRETGLTASAGIASLKFLAKVASDYNKPNGQFVITPPEGYNFISELPLNKISGVGKVTFAKLKSLGLEYGRDIQAVHRSVIDINFGKFGQVLYQRCQGVDDRTVETVRVRKSVGVERTFAEDIEDIAILRDILIDKLMPELKRRAEKYLCEQKISKLGVKVKFNDFQQTTKDCAYVNFDEGLFLDLLTDVVQRGGGKKVRLLGLHIGLGDIEDKSQQLEWSW